MAKSAPRLVLLDGTDLPKIPGATVVGRTHSTQSITLTLHITSKQPQDALLEQLVHDIVDGKRGPLTRAEFVKQFGAPRSAFALVRRFAKQNRFRVTKVNAATRMVHLTGNEQRLARAFGVKLVRYRLGKIVWNSYAGAISVPIELAPVVTGVYGFDERPELSRLTQGAHGVAAPTLAHSYSARDVAEMYAFPRRDGRGQSIGVIALGGGFRTSDLREFFKSQQLPMPRYSTVSVCGARNAPAGLGAAYDGEVTGDIETIGAIVPAARITVYFAPNTTRGFFEAVSTAVHDATRNITVLSISWGQAEVHWRLRTLLGMNRVLLEAAAMGVTVCCSSGDHGSFADTRDRNPHVCFPGSSPWALACGGTTLIGKGRRIVSETVWHNATGASGGGVSVILPRPRWQKHSRVPLSARKTRGRGVPDVAAHADPLIGYRFYCAGGWHVGAGTSASAPMWAGLVARLNEGRRHPIGLLTPHLYNHFSKLVRHGAMAPITKGGNGLFHARRGWSCCTGLGTPRGATLDRALRRHLVVRKK